MAPLSQRASALGERRVASGCLLAYAERSSMGNKAFVKEIKIEYHAYRSL
jgi:hypothetical protein